MRGRGMRGSRGGYDMYSGSMGGGGHRDFNDNGNDNPGDHEPQIISRGMRGDMRGRGRGAPSFGDNDD